MAKATHTPTTTRRRLLSGSAALTLAAAGATAPVHAAEADDAELIAACEAFNAIERQIKAIFAVPYDHLGWEEASAHEDACGERQQALCEQQAPIVERIVSLPCLTAAGQRALAECYALQVSWPKPSAAGWGDGLVDDPEDDPRQRVLVALARAVLGKATTFNTARRPPVRSSPEALAAVAARASEEAELLDCAEQYCETFDKAWELTADVLDAPPALEAEARRLHDIADGFAARAILLPATTREGEIAKLRLISRWTQADLSDGSWRDPESTESNLDRMVMSLFHDMTDEA